MGDVHDLAFLCNTVGIRWYGAAHLSLDDNGVPICGDYLDNFDSEIRNSLRKGAPNGINATVNRHDTLTPIGGITSEGVICKKSRHPIDIMSIIGVEELLGNACEIYCVRFHGTPPHRCRVRFLSLNTQTTVSAHRPFPVYRAETNVRWQHRAVIPKSILRASDCRNQPYHSSDPCRSIQRLRKAWFPQTGEY